MPPRNIIMKKIAIIGAGSWGTALALALPQPTAARDLAMGARCRSCRDHPARRANNVFLPGFKLPRDVALLLISGGASRDAGIVLGVMPSAHARLYTQCEASRRRNRLRERHQGPRAGNLLRMTEVIHRKSSRIKRAPRIAVLSGPSFAREVARGDPTAIVIASEDGSLLRNCRKNFPGQRFGFIPIDDVIGVELAGAVKNVIAIAAGVTRARLRPQHARRSDHPRSGGNDALRLRLGGRRETMAGFAGMGDLVLTCTGALSRNRAVGVELGHGRALEEFSPPRAWSPRASPLPRHAHAGAAAGHRNAHHRANVRGALRRTRSSRSDPRIDGAPAEKRMICTVLRARSSL